MRFLQSSIRYKLIALMLISTLIPIAASITVTYFYTKESVKAQTVLENSRLITEGKTNLINYLERLNKASLIPYGNKTMETILSEGVTGYEDESYVFTTLQLVFQSANDVYQVYLYINKNQTSFLKTQSFFDRQQTDSPPVNERKLSPYAVWTAPTHLSSHYGVQQLAYSNPELVFTLQRPLFRVPSPEQIGFLAIDIKLDALSKLSSQLYNKDKEDFYIIDKSGSIIFASDDAVIGQIRQDAWIKQVLSKNDVSGNMEWNEIDFSGMIFYSNVALPSLNWTIVKRIPNSQLYEDTRNLTIINTALGIFALTIAIAAVLTVSIRLTHPIKKLIRSMNQIQAGHLEYPIDIDRVDEIGTLALRFRTMMSTINDLILREYRLNLANKTTQLKMLQAQINPHFMNNALQLIGATALESGSPKVYALVSSLGQMMHYSMNTEEAIVPLSREIEYVNYYLLFQQQRFEEKLQIETEIDVSTANIPIPKMIVQPLVENFFKHGFHSTAGIGRLRIVAWIEEETLYIRVEDNGIGVPEAKMTALKRQLTLLKTTQTGQGEKIGLINVMSRLLIYYGDRANMELEGQTSHGLIVTLVIPLNPQEESS
ncbi:HAMP domain-containing protein [Paenibacillus sp. SYP-B3998]|uniref:HAMP domain-containing protein n=1 Tax=Paenibacillus sp. SYP-B3998 TaxID=2678564 RepID=A0A6G3ZZ53_9BACL|nr:sensor histidine kinase [Paenibacillus sp. SYP-B3998]NEW06974.1 HAMP domain-containing protein [Paenibacillus sp. SYP-B3998]